ncbi:MAG: TIGR04086 family membrane protein [Lachnospiraceae bacterium]
MEANPKIISFIRTLFLTYILTAAMLLILALILFKFKLSQSQVKTGVYAIYIITCFLGGFITGKTMHQRRFLWGMVFGVLYFIVLLAASFAMNKELYQGTAHMLTVLALCVGSGMVGGMAS